MKFLSGKFFQVILTIFLTLAPMLQRTPTDKSDIREE